jgi:serine/threonine-protein kinase RsbW
MTTICALIGDIKDVSVVVKKVAATAVGLGGDPDAVDDIVLALYEALANSIIHGYQNQPGQVEIEIQQQGDDLLICLRDKAPLHNPLTNPAPDTALPLAQRGFGGMGIHMMRSYSDDIRYQVTASNQNELIFVKKNVFVVKKKASQ